MNLTEHVNCRCNPYDPLGVKETLDSMKQDFFLLIATPERILKNGDVTIVFWEDGTKTIVKPEPGTTLDDYTAFTAALAKRLFGSNSKLKKVIRTHTEYQAHKGKKKDV